MTVPVLSIDEQAALLKDAYENVKLQWRHGTKDDWRPVEAYHLFDFLHNEYRHAPELTAGEVIADLLEQLDILIGKLPREKLKVLADSKQISNLTGTNCSWLVHDVRNTFSSIANRQLNGRSLELQRPQPWKNTP